MISLVVALVLAFLSFIASAIVIFRIVIPILPPHPLSKRVPPVSFLFIARHMTVLRPSFLHCRPNLDFLPSDLSPPQINAISGWLGLTLSHFLCSPGKLQLRRPWVHPHSKSPPIQLPQSGCGSQSRFDKHVSSSLHLLPFWISAWHVQHHLVLNIGCCGCRSLCSLLLPPPLQDYFRDQELTHYSMD